jgi:hypothetical protein
LSDANVCDESEIAQLLEGLKSNVARLLIEVTPDRGMSD